MKVPIFEHEVVYPFRSLGLTGGFWQVHLDTLIYTWAAMAFLFVVALIARWHLKREPGYFLFAFEKVVEFFADLCIESIGYFNYNYFALVASLFFFSLGCNVVGVFPFIEESTKDLNTTLAIALVSFLYVQTQKIKKGGLFVYIKEYFQPIFLLFPLNIIDRVAKIISMSFRLFGNILGGSIIFFLLVQVLKRYKLWFISGVIIVLLGYWLVHKLIDPVRHKNIHFLFNLGWVALYALAGAQIFFGIFEGVIQAFVVAMLTVTYLSVAVGQQDQDSEKT